MDINDQTQVTIGTYVKAWWRKLPRTRKRRLLIVAGIFSLFWLAGTILALTAVAGIARMNGFVRFIAALFMGGFAFLWQFLKSMGVIQETLDKPNLLWFLLAAIAPGLAFLIGYVLSQPPNPQYAMQKKLEESARAQGRVTAEDLREKLAIKQGIPLTQLENDKASAKKGHSEKILLGLDYEKSEGHALVVAPTRAGKGLHLTDTLRYYPGPVLVVDPKGEVRRAA